MLRTGDRLALLTSGGDAPGMNAAIRAAAKVGAAQGLEVVGIEDGYLGLMEGRVRSLDMRVLDDAARRGGTVLGSARTKVFLTPDGQKRARQTLGNERIAGLLVIGGNGSLAGAHTLADAGVSVGGLPASIDNDLACTSMAIGVDTAMNTIVEATDRICDTAAAHRRAFVIEVMGRDSGYLAMTSAIAALADAALVPEVAKSEEAIVEQVALLMERVFKGDARRRRVIVIKAEGVRVDAARLKEAVSKRIALTLPDVDMRVSVLGHIVRGGAPSAFDRLLAARLAHSAVRAMIAGDTDFMAGWHYPGMKYPPCLHDPYVVLTPLEEVLSETERLVKCETEVGSWRKRIFEEIESILAE